MTRLLQLAVGAQELLLRRLRAGLAIEPQVGVWEAQPTEVRRLSRRKPSDLTRRAVLTALTPTNADRASAAH